MCGILGFIDSKGERPADAEVLRRMTDRLVHRGPNDSGYFVEGSAALGFRRLSIIDLEGGNQPLYNEDRSVVLVCNGEIYNYRELRKHLVAKGHVFRTNCDVEVVLHLYEESGLDLLNQLNGQFAFAIYDRNRQRLLLARDHFGINPLYYTLSDGVLIFGSEIKAILEHPLAPREVDLTGLDQVLSFPGLVSPRTVFKNIESLRSGHYLTLEKGDVSVREYWDLDYPQEGAVYPDRAEADYVAELRELFTVSVKRRLQADVPVGFYLSGGLDSSLIAATIEQVSPEQRRHSFSISFRDGEITEAKYQQLMAEMVGSVHHDITFDWPEIMARLADMIYHCECPVKETYNTCSMALSEAARSNDIPVVLTGEGADELFAGYVGYRFDEFGHRGAEVSDLEALLEEQLREQTWGDRNLFYESELASMGELKKALYATELASSFKDFNCLNFPLVNKARLRGRHPLHQRSYLDFHLRLSDHLISDHGDRMALANSVEARYPFLDIDLIEFSTHIPPHLKLNQLSEKYILKKAAEGLLPREVIRREKFGFHAPGSPYLLQQNIEWVADLLSYERIRRDGYFNPDAVERLKTLYGQRGFRLNLPFETDYLMIVLSFNILLDRFRLPRLR